MDDPTASLRAWLDDLRFWDRIRGDAKRTIFCPPAVAEQCRQVVENAGLADTLTVLASPIVPEGMVYVLDAPAMEAWERQQALALLKGPGL